MSDLISICDVLSYILYVQNSGLGKKKALEYIYKYVENAISAYNVDAVVKELVEKSFIDYDEYYTDGGECLISISDAIEIVRKGGVE